MFAQLHSDFTCYLRTPSGPTAGPAHLLPPAATTPLFTWTHHSPGGTIKDFLCSHIKACSCFPKINRECYVTGKLHCCFCFVFFFPPEKTVVISPGLPWWPVCGEDLCVICGWCYVRAALIRARLAKHTKAGYSEWERTIKDPTLLCLILSFKFCFLSSGGNLF